MLFCVVADTDLIKSPLPLILWWHAISLEDKSVVLAANIQKLGRMVNVGSSPVFTAGMASHADP